MAVQTMERAVASEFCGWHDAVKLLGQDNLRRYLPVSHLRIRLRHKDSPPDVVIAAAAALMVNCRAVFSYQEDACVEAIGLLHRVTSTWAGRIETIEESDTELSEVIVGGGVDRLRLLRDDDPIGPLIRQACIQRFVPILSKHVIASGFIELLWFLQEQSLSFDYHRYGNLGRRAGESRRELVG